MNCWEPLRAEQLQRSWKQQARTLKTVRIGQSAAKLSRNGQKVQRLDRVTQTGRNIHECGACRVSVYPYIKTAGYKETTVSVDDLDEIEGVELVPGDDECFREWLKEKYEAQGLVGLVNAKGFECSYGKLVEMLEAAGIDHGLDAVSSEGLGSHIEEVFRRACDGETSSEIAAALGAKTKTVTRYCSRHGIELQKPLVLRDLDDEVRELAAEGNTIPQIAAALGFSPTAIRKYCEANGISTESGKPGFIIQNGYKLMLEPTHPNADSKGYVREHRLIVEKKLGRHLLPEEVIHHKDGDKRNNDLNNLEVMTLSEHAKLHALAGDTGWFVHHHGKGGKKI